MEQELKKFIEEHVAHVKPLLKNLYKLHWEFDTTGNNDLIPQKEKLEHEYLEVYADLEKFAKLKSFKESNKIKDPMLRRQLKRLYNAFMLHKGGAKYIDDIVKLESEIGAQYNQFRGKIDGKPHNDNELGKILHHETNLEIRKKAWEASKQIGERVADKVLQVVKIRNKSAHESGFRDYYQMALTLKELNEDKMFETLGRLAELTNEPFREIKRRLDEDRAKKFGIKVEDLRPWHYGDPFFQQVPPRSDLDIDDLFKEVDIEGLTIKTFDSIGMEIRDILERSDLYPKEGKCQHAYCTSIDQQDKDIRILCNIDQTERWMSTTLHEFGHGVYDKYIDGDLPYLLNTTPHTLSTEAIAMMMDNLSKDPDWLIEVASMPQDTIEPIREELKNEYILSEFIFVRWGLVMVYFERELYRDPEQDLNKLWWDLVEKFQYIRRPENRNAPDWAAKIHLALCPVYYQNYLYGELVSSQLQHYIRNNVGNGKLYNNAALGEYLIQKYFESGCTFDWNKTLKQATGEKLKPEYFVQESLKIVL